MTVTPGRRAKGMAKIQGVAQARSKELPLQTPDTVARAPPSTQASHRPPTASSPPPGHAYTVGPRPGSARGPE